MALKAMRKMVDGAWFILLMLLACTGLVSAQTCVQAPTGLVSWWPGEGTADDIVNGNDGTLQGGAMFVAGKVGEAFSFDGINGSVLTPLLLPPVGTIELWVNPTSLSSPASLQILAGTHGTASGDDRLWVDSVGPAGGIGVDPNTLVVNVGSRFTNDLVIPNPLTAGTWTHLALTFDYTLDVYRLYVNGTLEASATAPRNAPSQAFRIGGATSDFGQNFFFHGAIDEVSVYNRALTASDIQAIFEAGTAGKCKGQVLGGSVTGVSPTKVKCLNLTARQSITIRDGAASWDCEAAGLTVNPGDRIRMVVEGTAD